MGAESKRRFMYYVYIIYSAKLGKEYIGFTGDLKKRLIEHNQQRVSYTSRGVPWELIYYEAFVNKKDAMNEEKFFKTGSGRERRKLILEYTRRTRNQSGEVA
ncbi:MAG: Excinuclease ABC subunit C [Parcubacteria group bacterium GW2011_GWA2_42_28]|nr:MAG: Excinuclease ABC subunit C [Parcubacteria group bacterium GW2011_GWA2_42_28]KKT55821.1 MAG: Excinuclease ABC subunit C [Parcubacteria group bacterium GW2011_GWC2_44_22]